MPTSGPGPKYTVYEGNKVIGYTNKDGPSFEVTQQFVMMMMMAAMMIIIVNIPKRARGHREPYRA
jgi:hypothetical protein